MSKKSTLKIEEKKRLTRSKLKKNLWFGLFLGLITGFCLGYFVRKYTSCDAQKRRTEKAFYHDRLGEIKSALGQVKARIHFDSHENDVCYHCEDLEHVIESELNA